MADVKSPNRSELLKTKKKIGMAKRGHSLLKKKRDGLVMSFFSLLENAKDLRGELTQARKEAEDSLRKTRIVSYDLEIKFLAKTTTGRDLIDFQTKNIMGLNIPQMKATFGERTLTERGKTVYASASIDETMEKYESLVQKIIIVAEVETAMIRLLKEIEKTKRRVNGLEHRIIPGQEAALSFIRLSLEEQERDNLITLKRIKSKKERAKA